MLSDQLHDMWCNAYRCWEANVGDKRYQLKRMKAIERLAKRWKVELK